MSMTSLLLPLGTLHHTLLTLKGQGRGSTASTNPSVPAGHSVSKAIALKTAPTFGRLDGGVSTLDDPSFTAANYRGGVILLEVSSSAVKLQVMGLPRQDNVLHPLMKVRYVTELKHALTDGSISLDEFEKIYGKIAKKLNSVLAPYRGARLPLQTLAIATGPFREQPELKVLLDKIGQGSGILPKVIAANEEARLFYQGTYPNFIENHPEAKGKNVLMVDMGGASTELILADRPDKEIALHSLNFGEGTTNGHYNGFVKQDFDAIRTRVREQVQQDLGAKQATFQHPDYVVWDYKPHLNLLSELVWVDSSENAHDKIYVFKDSVSKAQLEGYTKDSKALLELYRRANGLSDTHRGKPGYSASKIPQLPVLMAIMLGVLDATKAEAVSIRQYGGIPNGMARELRPECTLQRAMPAERSENSWTA